MPEDLGWEWFIRKVRDKSGIDLNAYKRPQMERRITSFMRSAGAADYAAFLRMMDENHDLYRKFIEHLTINVSEFFRNGTHWDTLLEKMIPELLKERNTLRIWSAGCSTGEEPYSLGIMMRENFPQKFESIWATDLDQDALAKAQAGLYPRKAVQTMPAPMLKKYFTEENDCYRVKDEIKSLVRFQKHDLLHDAFPKNIDLILCRNVVIYFTEETKNRLYSRFVSALSPNGILFIGSTEQIFQARELGLKSTATFFYQKI